jgi:hypothetical protein
MISSLVLCGQDILLNARDKRLMSVSFLNNMSALSLEKNGRISSSKQRVITMQRR